MNRIYTYYIVVVVLLILSAILPPVLAISGLGGFSEPVYALNSLMCHQLPQRSFCIFRDGETLSFDNCINTGQEKLTGLNKFTDRPHIITRNSKTGYEFGQDARNTSIYIFMLIGALVFAKFNRTDTKYFPRARWLILALIPIGIDGGTQLLADFFNPNLYWLSFMGLHNSTNLLRVITGSIAGFAISFYVIPILNWLFSKK